MLTNLTNVMSRQRIYSFERLLVRCFFGFQIHILSISPSISFGMQTENHKIRIHYSARAKNLVKYNVLRNIYVNICIANRLNSFDSISQFVQRMQTKKKQLKRNSWINRIIWISTFFMFSLLFGSQKYHFEAYVIDFDVQSGTDTDSRCILMVESASNALQIFCFFRYLLARARLWFWLQISNRRSFMAKPIER